MGHLILQAINGAYNITIKQIRYFMCENYIVHSEKHIVLPNTRYLWFASMDFIYFYTNTKQDYSSAGFSFARMKLSDPSIGLGRREKTEN